MSLFAVLIPTATFAAGAILARIARLKAEFELSREQRFQLVYLKAFLTDVRADIAKVEADTAADAKSVLTAIKSKLASIKL